MACSAVAEAKALHVPAAYGEPPDGWTWSRLDDVSEGVFDCPHSTPKLTDSGPFVVRTQDIITGVFRTDQAGRVSEETYTERIARVTPSRGDILYSREGTYFGIAAEVPAKTRVCLGQRMVLIRPDKRRLDFSFLRHWLNSPIMAAHIHGYRDGSVAERLNLPTIRALPVLLPPLTEQKAIAAVLGALDDKIELNRRMNATLEAMARALFQSWFIDFDPVRRNADRDRNQPSTHPAGHPSPTGRREGDEGLVEYDKLFPDSFQDSALGHIPEGWEVKTLADLTSLITKGTTPTQDDVAGAPEADSQVNYIRVNSIDEDGSILPAKVTTIPESVHAGALKRSILQPDDVLYTIAGTIGRIALAEDWILPANTNQAVAVIRPEQGIPPGFLILSMRHEAFREELHHNVVHAVQANLSLGILSKAKIVVPPEKVLRHLFAPIGELLRKISANRAQSRTLATLRDTLLPKLLSGELSVNH